MDSSGRSPRETMAVRNPPHPNSFRRELCGREGGSSLPVSSLPVVSTFRSRWHWQIHQNHWTVFPALSTPFRSWVPDWLAPLSGRTQLAWWILGKTGELPIKDRAHFWSVVSTAFYQLTWQNLGPLYRPGIKCSYRKAKSGLNPIWLSFLLKKVVVCGHCLVTLSLTN